MKKSNAALIFCCIALLFLILSFCLNPSLVHHGDVIDVIKLILCIIVVVIYVITLFFNKSIEKNIKMNGEKKKGYIIAINDDFYFGCIDIYVDGKVYTFTHIKKNDIYVNLFETFQDRYSLNSDYLLLKGIPIDVYVDGDKVSPVLESVKLEKI